MTRIAWSTLHYKILLRTIVLLLDIHQLPQLLNLLPGVIEPPLHCIAFVVIAESRIGLFYNHN